MNYPKERYRGDSPWINKEWLYNEYVTLDKSTKQISEEYGCKQNTIQSWLLKHGIKKEIKKRNRSRPYQYQHKEYLFDSHIVQRKSIPQIAKENNVSDDTIIRWLKINEIDYWKLEPQYKIPNEKRDEIVALYENEKLSANQIANMYDTSHNIIINTLKRFGVKTRTMQDAQFTINEKELPKLFNDKEQLEYMHWKENKSCREIGEMIGVDSGTIRRQMNRLGIKTKNNSESKRGLMVGEKHPNWQGGLTPLKALLREYFQVNQVPVVAKRDNYTCQLCGATHTVLHVHHIVPFSEIVNEIVSEHPNLNPDIVEDRLKLYEIITHDDRFLNENNLITFCKPCHLYKIHNYTQNKTISIQASKEEGSETIPKGSTP